MIGLPQNVIRKQGQNDRPNLTFLDSLCSGRLKVSELNGFFKGACRQRLILRGAALAQQLRKFLGGFIRRRDQFRFGRIKKPPHKQGVLHHDPVPEAFDLPHRPTV